MKQATMFSKDEIKRYLLGGLECALFLPECKNRFGNSRVEAIRSFIVPLLLMPITILFVLFYPVESLADNSPTLIVFLYSVRLIATWLIYLAVIYWIAGQLKRKDHYYQFVTASNWLTVPSTFVFLPIYFFLFSGLYTWDELYPFMLFTMFYAYAFSGFMAALTLRIPLELGGFIAFLAFAINSNTLQFLEWVGSVS